MNWIIVEPAKAQGRCMCCGATAETHIGFGGSLADKKAGLDLCPGCRGILKAMLTEETAEHASGAMSRNVPRNPH